MRDISSYEVEYNKEMCESIQVQYRKKIIIEQIEKYNHGSILEIGCGNSPLFDDFFDYNYMTVVEPGNGFYENARQKAELHSDKKIVVLHGLLEDVKNQLLEKKYDYVILSALLHEVPNQIELLNVIYELCSKDTTVHINVPNAYSIHRILAKEMRLIDDIHEVSQLGKKLQQYSVFDVQTLKQLVESVGFFIIDSGSYFPKFFSYSQLEKMLIAGIIDEDYFEGMYALGKFLPQYGSEIFVQIKKG